MAVTRVRRRFLTSQIIWSIGFLVALTAWTPSTMRRSPRALAGWTLYDRYCLACHGSDGTGDGPAAPFTSPAPRDLTSGTFAWRSTPLGQPPTHDDLRTVIRHGAPGTSMPAFALSPSEVDQLVEVVQAFAPAASTAATPITLAPPPPPDPARGAALWMAKGCASCHGPTGTGDSVVARSMTRKPYDLTLALHRPRATDDADGRRRAAALSIATGLAGTAMPGYAGSITDAELWALADHVVALRRGDATRRTLDVRAIELDRTDRIPTGSWPAADPDDGALFGGPITAQGVPPAALAPAQASLSSQQCARCHAKHAREWQGSLHHGATSPGLAAQMWNISAKERASCLRCHAPLPEQQTAGSPLYADAVGCATCHVRGWTRHGPPNVAPSLLPVAGYPLTTLAVYERADFCLPCHQLPPRTEVKGRPLLDTYREWLEGPYMRRGVQCQHCHMPNREHSFKGIHDPDTFRQGIALTTTARVASGKVDVVAELANVGAGHYLPTTPTPAAWLSIELLDGKGQPIAGARDRVRIGRHIEWTSKGWVEHADTRIPPGEKLTMARAWTGGRVGEARTARIVVEVHPDDYYEGLYQQRLAGKLAPERRALYEQALARGRRNHYIAERRDVPLPVSSSKQP